MENPLLLVLLDGILNSEFGESFIKGLQDLVDSSGSEDRHNPDLDITDKCSFEILTKREVHGNDH